MCPVMKTECEFKVFMERKRYQETKTEKYEEEKKKPWINTMKKKFSHSFLWDVFFSFFKQSINKNLPIWSCTSMMTEENRVVILRKNKSIAGFTEEYFYLQIHKESSVTPSWIIWCFLFLNILLYYCEFCAFWCMCVADKQTNKLLQTSCLFYKFKTSFRHNVWPQNSAPNPHSLLAELQTKPNRQEASNRGFNTKFVQKQRSCLIFFCLPL